jgi:hypothetical protein
MWRLIERWLKVETVKSVQLPLTNNGQPLFGSTSAVMLALASILPGRDAISSGTSYQCADGTDSAGQKTQTEEPVKSES